jgi:hypothetical protein
MPPTRPTSTTSITQPPLPTLLGLPGSGECTGSISTATVRKSSGRNAACVESTTYLPRPTTKPPSQPTSIPEPEPQPEPQPVKPKFCQRTQENSGVFRRVWKIEAYNIDDIPGLCGGLWDNLKRFSDCSLVERAYCGGLAESKILGW